MMCDLSMRRCLAALSVACVTGLAAGSAHGLTFTDVTAAAGIVHSDVWPAGTEDVPYHKWAGGAAAGDYDGDGWVDLYVSRFFDTDILYRNNSDGTFTNVTTAAFPSGLGATSTNGVAWGDIDNDGDLDLYVTGLEETRHFLYINNGDGTFAEQALARGAAVDGGSPAQRRGTSASFGDYDNDGYLDVYVTEWRSSSVDYPGYARLLRNLGAANPGYFEDVTIAADVDMSAPDTTDPFETRSFTPRFSDLDRDGRQDLGVISDFNTSRLFWNNGDGTFDDNTPALLTTGTNDMGYAVGDVNGDGLLDWFATSIYNAGIPALLIGNRLYLNNGDRTFSDVTETAGVKNGSWGWGADMFDFDNDGDLDIIHTNGNSTSAYATDRVRLFVNNGDAVFTESSLLNGIFDTGQGRGLLTFDYDNDGDIDVYIVNSDGTPVLYQNSSNTNGNDWLNVKTVGTLSNRNGIGAFITVTPDLNNPDDILVWEIDGSSNYLAQSEMTAHFGLGDDYDSVDLVTIEWIASGIIQHFTDVPLNSTLIAVEHQIGDVDGDGDIDVDDATLVKTHFGELGPGSLGDADGDGDSDIDDLVAVKNHFGWVTSLNVPPPGLGFVPEPTTAAVWLTVVAICAARRRPARL